MKEIITFDCCVFDHNGNEISTIITTPIERIDEIRLGNSPCGCGTVIIQGESYAISIETYCEMRKLLKKLCGKRNFKDLSNLKLCER